MALREKSVRRRTALARPRRCEHRHVSLAGGASCGRPLHGYPGKDLGMSNTAISFPAKSGLLNLILRARASLETVPYALLALPLRAALATVFWNSGTTKLASW